MSRKSWLLLSQVLSWCALVGVCLIGQSRGQDQWARWRGPAGNGIAASGQTPPTTWSDTDNVIWKIDVPGRGHASPIVLEDRILLATAEPQQATQSVVCFDRATGKRLWKTKVNEGGFATRIHPKNTHASPTIATDGERAFAVFSHHDSVSVTAIDLEGKILWSKDVGKYDPAYPFGFGASPIVYQDKVIVTNENKAQGGVVAYDTRTGNQIWRIDRGQTSSYSTPVIAEVAGKAQMLLSGGKTVKSYDPDDGHENWSTPTKWDVSCGTMVWDGNLVFASGGFPANQTLAIDAGTGEMIWELPVKAYEQSLLAHAGYVYAHADNSVIYCWQASDGKEMWKQRFSNRRIPVSASPVLVNGLIHFTAENGETVVIKADPESYQEVARNQLGTEAFATPAFCGNQIFARVGDSTSGSRVEFLYCLGEK